MSKGFKSAAKFPEIPGESLMDRRIRYWKWQRRNAACAGLSKSTLRNGRPLNNAMLSALVRDLQDQILDLRTQINSAGQILSTEG